MAEKVTDSKERAARNQEKKLLTPVQIAAKDARLDGQVARVNSKLSEKHQLDPEQVKAVAKERGYDTISYATLGKMERNAEKGTFTSEHYEYPRTGRVQQETALRELPAQKLYADLPPTRWLQ
ncbi:MAG: hypothetical protein EOO57_06960 [Hymenobacter sp.]|nr:MAG: hypothetical protein EOO57_06960 [Hymenobacter sp.]